MSLTKVPLGMVDISELDNNVGDIAVYDTNNNQLQIINPFVSLDPSTFITDLIYDENTNSLIQVKLDTSSVSLQGFITDNNVNSYYVSDNCSGFIQGDKGLPGIDGKKGDDGSSGCAGVRGDTGPAGLKGMPGKRGRKGDRGKRGLEGNRGLQGPPGDKGDTGLMGGTGPDGLKGKTGLIGPMGLRGETGDKGEQGEQGYPGPIGSVGIRGETGDKGPDGPPGPPGCSVGIGECAPGEDAAIQNLIGGDNITIEDLGDGEYRISCGCKEGGGGPPSTTTTTTTPPTTPPPGEPIPCSVFFTDALVAGKEESGQISKAYVLDKWSDIVKKGNYPNLSLATPTCSKGTLDGFAVAKGTHIVMYSKFDYGGVVHLEVDGPFILLNSKWSVDFKYLTEDASEAKWWPGQTAIDFPKSCRHWSAEYGIPNMNVWTTEASFKVTCIGEGGEPPTAIPASLLLYKSDHELLFGTNPPSVYQPGYDIYVKVSGRGTGSTNANRIYMPLEPSKVTFKAFTGDLKKATGIDTLAYNSVTTNNTTYKSSFLTYLKTGVEISTFSSNHVSTSDQDKELLFKLSFSSSSFASQSSITPLSSEKELLMQKLTEYWMSNAVDRIRTYYGLKLPQHGDARNIMVMYLHTDNQEYVAAVSALMFTGAGPGFNQELHFDMNYASPVGTPGGGGTSPSYNDRTLTHELVHAYTNRCLNSGNLPTWFKEGTAEFIHGADERLIIEINNYGISKVVSSILGTWPNSSLAYAGAFVAIRMLHKLIKDAGGSGISDLFTLLDCSEYYTSVSNSEEIVSGKLFSKSLPTLDSGFKLLPTSRLFSSASTFLTYFANNGSKFINDMIAAGMLSNTDTGAIGGRDADGAANLSPIDVIGDTAIRFGDNYDFSLIWPNTGIVDKLNIVAEYETSKSQTVVCYDVYGNDPVND